MRNIMHCGCVVEAGDRYAIDYCKVHRSNVNPSLFALAQMVCMWDGDSGTYVEILRQALPLVRAILNDPDWKG